jgi:transposase-like protein
MTTSRGRQMNRRPCLVCQHAERQRIDYLVARGETVSAVARKFKVSPWSLHRHAANHISPEFRNVVQASPLESLESLQKLACESGASVVDNLQAIYSGLSNRWLSAFEAADDHRLSVLTSKLHQNLELRTRISKELLPAGSTYNVQNNFLLSDAGQLLRILQPFPEARAAIVAYYSEKSSPKVIEHHGADD